MATTHAPDCTTATSRALYMRWGQTLGEAWGQTAFYYPGTKETHIGQAFQPDTEPCQAEKPDLLPCRGNISPSLEDLSCQGNISRKMIGNDSNNPQTMGCAQSGILETQVRGSEAGQGEAKRDRGKRSGTGGSEAGQVRGEAKREGKRSGTGPILLS